jgi:hypothetical protein
MTYLFDEAPPPCTTCGAGNSVPLIFGSPSEEMLTASALGHIALGGPEERALAAHWMCQAPECHNQH